MDFQKLFIPLLSLIKKRGWFILVLLSLAVFRFHLATSGGRMYWPDEKLYNLSAKFLDAIEAGNYREGLGYLFRTYPDRPGFVFLSAIPASIQRIIAGDGKVEFGDPDYFDPPALFNVLVSLLISVVFYRVLLILTGRPNQALLGMVVYGLLCNTNLYIRHLVPYDYSLLLFLISLFLVLRSDSISGITPRTAILSGIVSSLAFLVYPGYFLFVAIIAVLVFFLSRRRLAMILLHLLPAAAVIVLAELLARFSGSEYVLDFLQLGIRSQGSFEEGYVFAWRYLTEVEGLIGYALSGLFLIYLLYLLRRPPRSPAAAALFLAATGAYLFNGTYSVVFKSMVFRGRLFHMYVPFLVWGAVMTLNSIRREGVRIALCLALFGLSLVSFFPFAVRYGGIWYPRDFRYRFLGDAGEGDAAFIREDKQIGKGDLAGAMFVAVNLNHFSKIYGGHYPFDPPDDLRLIKSVSHPLNFRAYPFEGYSVAERRILRERDYQMRMYLRPRRKEVDLVLFTPEAKDYLLLVDIGSGGAGKDPGPSSVYLNDHLLSAELEENLNYIVLPRRMMRSPESYLKIRADSGIAPDILVDLAPLGEAYLIDLGRRSRISDLKFLKEGFFNTSRSGQYRSMNEAGEIKIPVFAEAPRLRLRVRNNMGGLSPLAVKLDLDGAQFASFTLPAEYRWTLLEAELPSAPKSGTARLGIRAVPISETPEIDYIRSNKGLLAIDRLAIERVPAPEEI